MILKICSYCQAENPENANFCKKCGAPFKGYQRTKDTVAEKSENKHTLIFAGCVILIIIALAVIMRGTGDEPEAGTTATSGTTVTTTVESTTLPALTIAPSANATTALRTTAMDATAPSVTASSTTEAVLSTTEICRQYNELVGAVKRSKDNISIHKTEKINLEISHFSLPVSTESINSFMAKLIPETDVTYNFTDGVAKEDRKVTLSGFIPPSVKSAPEVTEEDLLSTQKTADGSITLKFKADSSTFSDGQTEIPQYVDAATDMLDFATFSLGPIKIVKADIQYPATEIKAEVNTEGKLSKLTVVQPVTAMSTGRVGSLTADVGMKLKATTTYEIK